MTQKSLFIFCLIFGISASAAGQRSVTNTDLEKYRQSRLSAEREYRENHQRLGLRSPEELAVLREQSQAELIELSDRLRNARLERDRLAAERELAERKYEANRLNLAAAYLQSLPPAGYYDSPGIFYGGQSYRNRRRGPRQQEGYYAGGQFWPTGPRTKPRPLIARPRVPRTPRR